VTDSDFDAFSAALAVLAHFYPNSKPNLGVVTEGYFYGLYVLSLEEIDQVFTRAMQECKFFPTLAELRDLGGVPGIEAHLAWQARARQEARRLPLGRDPEEDAATLRLMRSLLDQVLPGWNLPVPEDTPAWHHTGGRHERTRAEA
jgi:hypothetical protein